jgi:hypothetical protein
MRGVTADQVDRFLHHLPIDYPASKAELLRAAQDAGAPDEIIRALRAIPPEEYGNRNEVTRSVPTAPGEELHPDAAQLAEQAREQRHHGGQHLSQYEREVPKPPIEDELGH